MVRRKKGLSGPQAPKTPNRGRLRGLLAHGRGRSRGGSRYFLAPREVLLSIAPKRYRLGGCTMISFDLERRTVSDSLLTGVVRPSRRRRRPWGPASRWGWSGTSCRAGKATSRRWWASFDEPFSLGHPNLRFAGHLGQYVSFARRLPAGMLRVSSYGHSIQKDSQHTHNTVEFSMNRQEQLLNYQIKRNFIINLLKSQ